MLSLLLHRVFCSCGEWGLLFTCAAGLLILWLLLLQSMGSLVCGLSSCVSWTQPQAQWWWCIGLVAPWHGESSKTRDWIYVSFIGRWLFQHWAIRETHKFFLKIFHFLENPLFFINIPKQYNYLDYTSLFKIFKSRDILSFRYNICIKDVLIDISAMKPQNSLFLKAHLLILKVFLRIVFQLIIFYIVFG